MGRLSEKVNYLNGYIDYAIQNHLNESYRDFKRNCLKDGVDVSENDYKIFRNRVREAIFMDGGDDPRSYNDIYGEDGATAEDGATETPAASVEQLGPAEIQQLRDLANQILSIVGPGEEDTAITGTPDFIED